jgi:Tfp pilus assembly protein PilO
VKRNQLLIGGAVLLVIVLLWWFLLYKPLGDDLSSAQAQTASEQKKTDSLQADLTRLQSQAKNASQQQALLHKLDAAVPEQPDLAEFIIQANDIADQSGISFLSIAPSPPATGTGGASVINVTITLSGSFFQLEDYLRLLEQLDRLVIVDGLTISASSGSSSSSTTGSSTADATTSSDSGDTSLSVTLTGRMFTRAAPAAGSSTGTSGGTTGGTTTTTVPGTATTTTTAPAASGSTIGGT